MSLGSNLRVLKALCEETRYKIVKVLLKEEKCACEIPLLINRTQSNTSMHLTKLVDIGIIKSRKEGRNVLYSLSDLKVREVFRALDYKNAAKRQKRLKK